jgi:hypothetical protein
MTVDLDDESDDELLAAVGRLRTYDVSPQRSRVLRRRCHAVLHTAPSPTRPARMMDGTWYRRIVGPALGGAWCLAYLLEIVRRAAAVYLGAQ